MDISLHLEPAVALFYTRIAALCGRNIHDILNDALFLAAGEMSLRALESAEERQREDTDISK